MASSFDMNLSTDTYKSLIMTLATGIVWKDTGTANKYESKLSSYESEIFIAANRGMLYWDIVDRIPKEIFLKLGYHPDDAEAYSANKKLIPEGIRSLVISEYQTALKSKNPYTGYYQYNVPVLVDGVSVDNYITIYEEKNNYYRMLMGLPDIEDHDYVYNTKNTNWPMDIPIHMLDLRQRLDIEESGYLDELINQYPEKKYLRYIGSKNIDFFTSRTAGRYEILWMNSIESSSTLKNDFKVVYEYNRNMVLNVYYSEAFRKDNSYYEPFLAMSILLMTIQVMNAQYLQKDVTREFYDTDSIRAVYESYGVPFYSEIPLEYHKRIVKSINQLISYKGSTQVVLDLFDIFNLGTMELFEYYLMKTHRYDEHNNPIFIYEKDGEGNYILDEDGNKILSEDQSGAYEIKFAKSKVGEDISLQLTNENNYVDYEDLILTDPYWIQDSELQEKINSEEFNYNESKYLGIQSVFNLMKITYETAYGLKAIVDNREITDKIEMNADGTLFDYIIYLGALYCKKKGWEGVISSDAATVSTYLGYDFKQNLETLKQASYYDKYIAPDSTIVDLLNKMNIQNITTVNSVLKNIEALREYLGEKMVSAKDHNEYYAYRDLYNTLLTGKFIEGVFDIEEGESTTFAEVLSKTSSTLYNRYLLIDDYEYEIENVVLMIEDAIPALENLSFIVGMDTSNLIDSLYKIVTFFKSAKAELVGLNVVYQLYTRLTGFIKFLDLLQKVYIKADIGESDLTLIDMVNYIQDYNSMYRDMIYILRDDNVQQYIKVRYKDQIKYLKDELMEVINRGIAKYSDLITLDELMSVSDIITPLKEDLTGEEDSLFDDEFIIALIQVKRISSQNFHMNDMLIDTTPEPRIIYLLTLIDRLRKARRDYRVVNDKILLSNDEFGTSRTPVSDIHYEYKSIVTSLLDSINYITKSHINDLATIKDILRSSIVNPKDTIIDTSVFADFFIDKLIESVEEQFTELNQYHDILKNSVLSFDVNNDELTMLSDLLIAKIQGKKYRYNTLSFTDRIYEIV